MRKGYEKVMIRDERLNEFTCTLRIIFSLFTSFNIATWYGSEVKDRSGNNF